MRKKELGKIGAFGIVLIFVFGAFVPAVGSVGKNGTPLTSSSVVGKGEEVSLVDFVGVKYDILVNVYLQTAIVGVVSIAFNSPLLNQVREFFTGQEKSNDVGARESGVNQIDDKISQEQDSDLVDARNPPIPLDSSDPWWDTDWLYRKEITIDHTKVVGNLVGFPVLISLASDPDLTSKAQSDGNDLVFTDKNGNKLNHEIEFFNGSSGKLVCWVNVASLSSTIDTVLYMYYGNTVCDNMQNQMGVWDSHFVMVQHLEETSGVITDSTSFKNNGTEFVSPDSNMNVTGKIDGAIDFDGTDDYVTFGQPSSLNFRPNIDEFTISLWLKTTDAEAAIIGKAGTTTTQRQYYFYTVSGTQGLSAWIGGSQITTGRVVDNGQWHHIVGLNYNNAGTKQFRFYLDGAADSTVITSGSATNSLDLLIGARRADTNSDFYAPLDGLLDEIRISKVARNTSWIKTEYNNQYLPDSFVLFGDEERPSECPFVINPVPSDGVINVSISLSQLSFTLVDNQNDTMNYSVMTIPNIIGGIQSDNNITNGSTVNIPILNSPLDYGHEYRWCINVTDGEYWNNKTFRFTTVSKAPIITDPQPADMATNIPNTLSELTFILFDYENDLMNYTVTMRPDKISGPQNGVNISNGTTVHVSINGPLAYNTVYTWFVNVTDEKEWTNKSYMFTTASYIPNFSIKWSKSIASSLCMQGATADLNGDGIKDVVYPISGGLRALNGIDGTVMWTRSISGSDIWSQVEVGDLNNDGIPECVTPVWSGALVAVHGNNGSVYWRTTLYGSDGAFAHPLILDYDNDGYPHIFEGDRGSNARIYKIRYDGVIEATQSITHLCAGGVTGGDFDNDGKFEIYFGDDDYSYEDNSPQHMESYWAENLTVRFRMPYYINTSYKYLASAGCPALADCNNDGLRDLVVSVGMRSGPISTGFAVLSAKDGSIIKGVNPLAGMSEHRYLNFQEVYDIDLDGNPEWITSTGHVIVYDLIKDKIDFYASANSDRWPPLIADVTGDGDKDLVVAMGTFLRVYDSHFNIVARIPESGNLPGSGYIIQPIATDMDNDGLNEIVLARGSGDVIVIDTVAPEKYGGSRAGVKGYSIYRQGVAEYVSILVLENEQPHRVSTGVSPNPTLSVHVYNLQDEIMNIQFRTNASGTWKTIGSYSGVGDGTYNVATKLMYNPLTKYWWSVNATDRKNTWTNMTYRFTTGNFIPIAPVITDISPLHGAIGVPITLSNISFRLLDHQGNTMNYTIVTNPDIGDSSGYNIHNGSYSMLVDNPLEYNTTYIWYVNVTDGTYWKNETYTFITATSEPVLLNEIPRNGANLININPLLKIDILDWQNDTVNWWIRTNSSGTWTTLNSGTFLNGTGAASAHSSNMNQYETKYWWSANVTDPDGSGNWINRTYHLITTPEPRVHVFSLNHTSHINYGLSYPITFIFNLSYDATDLQAFKYDSSWVSIPTKNITDLYSGIEAARFDYTNKKAYISISFPPYDDNSYIKITNSTGTLVYTEYVGIAHYYDNRKAAVTFTADDWCKTQDTYFKAAIDACQARNIWITPAIVTKGVAKYPEWHYPPDWDLVRNETAEGFVEPASHSCNHLNCTSGSTYNNYQWGVQSSYDIEIGGSKQSILENLTMPSLNRRGEEEYLYAWIEPFGHWDSTVSQKLGQYHYLSDRSTDSSTSFASWSNTYGTYNRIGVSVSADGMSASSMNTKFNSVYNAGGIHQIFLHPRNHNWVTGAIVQHLNYIANRSDVWYVGFGQLYAYHYMEERNVITHSAVLGNLPPILSAESPINASIDNQVGTTTLTINADDINNDLMNITFMTNASGSWQAIGNNISVPSGHYQQNYDFPVHNKTYWWGLKVTDGVAWKNETYSFKTRPENYLPILSNPIPANGATNILLGDLQLKISVNDRDNDLMNITFRTNATGIWSDIDGNVSQPNGTYSQIYTFTDYAYTYYWSVNCSDGKTWVNKTYNFKTVKEPITDPFAQGWIYRKQITINHTLVAGNLTGFPIMINISGDSDLKSYAQSDGDDILFMDGPGVANLLPHEIEYYNSTTGDLVVWVNMSTLSSTQDTILYMYYGNPEVENCQNITGTWDLNYRGVWHLDETSGIIYDSSSYGNNGTAYGVDQDINGLIDGADYFQRISNTAGDYISCPNTNSLNPTSQLTLEAWVKFDSINSSVYRQSIIGKYYTNYEMALMFDKSPQMVAFYKYGFTEGSYDYVYYNFDEGDINQNEWHHLAATMSGYYMKLYFDGILKSSSTGAFSGTVANTDSLNIGRRARDNTQYVGGILDEVRLSSTSRGNDWILTEYNNQRNHDQFIIVGGQEAIIAEPIVSNEIPRNGEDLVNLYPALQINIRDYQGDQVDWWIKTNASDSWETLDNGSVLSGEGQASTTNISTINLYETKYWWSINVTDPYGSGIWTNRTYYFTTTLELGAWWNTSWFYRKAITINHSKIASSSSLINFPVLITITDSDLAEHAQNDGDDFVFTDIFGNRLHHEIEFYNSTNGNLVCWVNVTSLSADADTIIYVYYGNYNCVNQENIEGVWDYNYRMVHHLEETNGIHYDSTIHNNDGTPYNGVNQNTLGIIDGADNFDGNNDYINIGTTDINPPWTAEFWVKRQDSSNSAATLADSSSYSLRVEQHNNTNKVGFTAYTVADYSFNYEAPVGSWVHLVFVGDSTSTELYVNGVINQVMYQSISCPMGMIGRSSKSAMGVIDEIRMSNIGRSPGWILTEYNNQYDPFSFYRVGAEEIGMLPEEPILSNESPENGSLNVTLQPVLSLDVFDYQNDTMNVFFCSNFSGNWQTIDIKTGVESDTFTCSNTSFMNSYSTTYWWSVNATDPFGSGNWTNKTYYFTTIQQPIIHEFTLNHSSHMLYGLTYPMTYIFSIPTESTNLRAYKFDDTWVQLPSKTLSDLYSGIEAARFNYTEDRAYISVIFPAESDILYVKITDDAENIIDTTYIDMATYYDNSKTAVVLTGDDWCGIQDSYFKAACDASQARNIWFTPGINSHGVAKYSDWHYPPNWTTIQNEVNEGFVEPGSHGRDHLATPYDLAQWGVQSSYDEEIGACKQDILENITMPSINRRGDQEYLWAWIEPFGNWDATVSQTLGEYYYLSDRSTGTGTSFSSWRTSDKVYDRCGAVFCADGMTAASMNTAFNTVYAAGGIHLIYSHPKNHDWVSGAIVQHLSYIANRSDVWYVGFGQLYAYHYMDERNVITHSAVSGNILPILSSESPTNESIELPVGATSLKIYADDINFDLMNLTFMTNASGGWQTIGSNTSVPPGSYKQSYIFSEFNRLYYWSVNATDGHGWTNQTYHFTTRPVNYLPVVSNPSPLNGATHVAVGSTTLAITVNDRDENSMGVIFRTNASGSWMIIGTNSSQPNGTYRQEYTFSDGFHAYWWQVNVTDGIGWSNMTYRFTTGKAPVTDPFAQGWTYRKSITINHSQVFGVLSGFPVLINISSDDDLASHAQSDGDDIIFMDGDGVAHQLPHEIEYYNATTGQLVVWVNVSTVSSAVDTTIYMYYGNGLVESYENVQEVWDSHYMMVHHLKETSGTHYDSTRYANDGTPIGGINQDALGKIDGADDFDGSNDYVNCGNGYNLDITNKITVSIWAKIDTNKNGRLLSKHGSGTGNYGWMLVRVNNYLHWCISTTGTDWNEGKTTAGTFPLNTWVYITATYDGSYMRVFVNGVEDPGQNLPMNVPGTIHVAPASTQIGRDGNTGDTAVFDGVLDEARISDIIRNSSWIQTEYYNQQNPSMFSQIGPEMLNSRFILSNPSPPGGSSGQQTSPSLSIRVNDAEGGMMTIKFLTNASTGSWHVIGTFTSQPNGTYVCTNTSEFNGYNTKYWWAVNVSGSGEWLEKTYHFITRPENYLPVLSNPWPADEATSVTVGTIPLKITIRDQDGNLMNVTFRTNTSGSWMVIGTNTSQPNGTYSQEYTFTDYSHIYWWSVQCFDGEGWSNATYRFTTRSAPTIHKFTLDHTSHLTYGLSYPVTYIFSIPSDASNLRAYKYVDSWTLIPNKNASDKYSGIEVARFNYTSHQAFISVSFPATSDEVYVKITDPNGTLVDVNYVDIASYYDNSKSVFVLTGDDWCGLHNSFFKAACDVSQARNIWFTTGINSHGVAKYPDWHNPPNWTTVQNEVNEGFVEPASHGRDHLDIPYNAYQWGVQSSYDGEINGCKQDILENITMPSLNRRGDQEYIWAWIEPFGSWDATVSQKLGQYDYLSDRSTGSSTGFSSWRSSDGVYDRVGVVFCADGMTASSMNSQFDSVYNAGGIFHVFCHPRNHNWTSGPIVTHLSYVANRSDVWYAGFGHLYAYHYMKERNVITHGTFSGNIPPVVSSESPVDGITELSVGNTTLRIRADDINGDSMTITFRTNASGSWQTIGSNISVPSGIYQQRYNFLADDQTYYWSVNTTDGISWTNQTYHFTTRPANYLPLLSNTWPLNGAADVTVGNIPLTITVSDQDGNLMNITFRTNASGSWIVIGTNTSQPNGTYRQQYTFSEALHTYWWRVNVTDGTDWVNATYRFTTGKVSVTNPFAQGWLYRKMISINHSQVVGNHTGFPVLINISADPDLASYAQSDGDDIIFMDGDGVAHQLPHEIEYYNTTTGRLVCWVNVSSLSSTVNTTFYMYYGNSVVGNCENISGAWDRNYRGIWHLNETSTSVSDSSWYKNAGTSTGVTHVNGLIDGADNFNHASSYINCPNTVSLNPTSELTLEAWVKFSDVSSSAGRQTIVGKYYTNYEIAVIFDKSPPWFAFYKYGTGTGGYDVVYFYSNPGDFVAGEWYHLAASMSGSTMKIYFNGVLKNTSSGTVSETVATTDPLNIGRRARLNNQYVGGVIDEVRLSSKARNESWIQTEYNNQKNPSTFYWLGSQETAPQGEYHYQISLNQTWNLISLPVNESTPKVNITVSYLGVNYSWQQAVTAGVILDSIYGWNVAGQNYDLSTILQPGHGYWVYAYSTCTFWVSSDQLNTDLSITGLGVSWNLVGVPFNLSVAKENLTVTYSGVPYTWQQAVTAGVVLDFIYGWVSTSQNYNLATVLQPGQCYWMYAYHACSLNKEES